MWRQKTFKFGLSNVIDRCNRYPGTITPPINHEHLTIITNGTSFLSSLFNAGREPEDNKRCLLEAVEQMAEKYLRW